jgi:hypothetical protein
MYKTTHPRLFARYSFDNFEAIAETFDKYFPDLFDLELLEAELAKEGELGSYATLFDLIIKKLQAPADGSLFTSEEILKKIHDTLANDAAVKKHIQTNFILVPPKGGKPSAQIGFLEKLATAQSKMPQSLTYIDMMRAVEGLRDIIAIDRLKPEGTILRLREVSSIAESMRKEEGVMIVDFNLDPKGMPKWGVIRLKRPMDEDYRRRSEHLHNPPFVDIYCEMPLTEAEKALVYRLFPEPEENKDYARALRRPINCFEHSNTSSLESTGLAALAKFEEWFPTTMYAWTAGTRSVTPAQFKLGADFPAALSSFFCSQFGKGKAYTLKRDERAYCDAAFLGIAGPQFSPPGTKTLTETSNALEGGAAFRSLASVASLGTLTREGHPLRHDRKEWRAGDIGALIQALHDSELTAEAPLYKNAYLESAAILLEQVSKTLEEYEFDVPRVITEVADLFSRGARKKILTVTEDRSELNLPEFIDMEFVVAKRFDYGRSPEETALLEAFLIRPLSSTAAGAGAGAAPVPDKKTRDHNAIELLLLNFIRTKTRKSAVSIYLPPYFEITPQLQARIVSLFSENPYVTTFNSDHPGLMKALEKELPPILSRNRWLSMNGYSAGVVDNYWKRAATYWLTHLFKHQDILKPRKTQDDFKDCVADMGLQGLEAVLNLLSDPIDQQVIRRMYEDARPEFFAAYPKEDAVLYLTKLRDHLAGKDSYFPFGALSLSCFPENVEANRLLLEVFDLLNQDQFAIKKLQLRGLLENPTASLALIKAITAKAIEKRWSCLISIPELDVKNNTPELRALVSAYAQLNNVLLTNRHGSSREAELYESLKPASPVATVMESAAATGGAGAGAAGALHHTASAGAATMEAWPIQKRRGGPELQMQQQQQVSVHRQLRQGETQTMANAEEAFGATLVNYGNIDALLGAYVASLPADEKPDASMAKLTIRGRTLLQNLFHTWINANPHAKAPQVIKQMTQEAVKALLPHARLLASGLNPTNLPRGFFMQRSHEGEMVLCYDALRGFAQEPNPLTPVLQTVTSKLEPWLGDFRQLAIERYTSRSEEVPLELEDWQVMAVFSLLQPAKPSYEAEVVAFIAANPTLSALLTPQQERLKRQWPIFMQAWQYQGEAGVRAFLAKSEADLSLTVPALSNALLAKQDKGLREWFQAATIGDLAFMRVLGHAKYLHGDQGVTFILTSFKRIHDVLGKDFFNAFQRSFIAQEPPISLDCFFNKEFTTTLDDMLSRLSKSPACTKAWLSLYVTHMKAAKWDNMNALWKGFCYFVDELETMGLSLRGNEFDGIPEGNVLVFMDRILESLKHIAVPASQRRFLDSLASMDMTHGGVPYALRYEGFRQFGPELQLSDFHPPKPLVDERTRIPNYPTGLPTYTPVMQGDGVIFSLTPLELMRLLAKKSLPSEIYGALCGILTTSTPTDRAKNIQVALLLIHTQYDGNILDVAARIQEWDAEFLEAVARSIARIAYEEGNKEFKVNLDVIERLQPLFLTGDKFLNKPYSYAPQARLYSVTLSYPQGTLFEVADILSRKYRGDNTGFSNKLRSIVTSMEESLSEDAFFNNLSTNLQTTIFKLAALFNDSNVKSLIKLMDKAPLGARQEIDLLVNQLLSLDFTKSNLASLASMKWADLLSTVRALKQSRSAEASMALRVTYIETLKAQGLVFNYSERGNVRRLSEEERDKPAGLMLLGAREAVVWKFLKDHVAIPASANGNDVLVPLMQLLRGFQYNKTYINELDQVMGVLNTCKEGTYWSADYLYELLSTLLPSAGEPYPARLLKTLIESERLGSQPLARVEKALPQGLKTILSSIAQHPLFNDLQKNALCKIALLEGGEHGGAFPLFTKINALLERYGKSNLEVFEFLASSPTIAELGERFKIIETLLKIEPSHPVVKAHWPETVSLLFKTINGSSEARHLCATILHDYKGEEALKLCHIFAWNTFAPTVSTQSVSLKDRCRKGEKLLEKIASFREHLDVLITYYPVQPAPSADDLLRIIKSPETPASFPAALRDFERHPLSTVRMDYGSVGTTRGRDFERLIEETQLTGADGKRRRLSGDESLRLARLFSQIKHLEQGVKKISLSPGAAPVALNELNKQELQALFRTLSRDEAVNDDKLAIIWAVLFEVMGRTTGKYPHLAQQFALLANEVCDSDSPSRVSQVATGEGKSHFIALRAARYAGQGKIVDICTAKRTLAVRDEEDYQSFYSYLGLDSAYIDPDSSHDIYKKSQIHYSTIGDLSLFSDKESYHGRPIDISRKGRVGLVDECDFSLFEQGDTTLFNYAKPTGRTPTEMMWFYQLINAFYDKHKAAMLSEGLITRALLGELIKELQSAARDNEARELLIDPMIKTDPPMQLVQWLQAAHEAAGLTIDRDFTVVYTDVQVGHATHKLRDPVPLSKDNQKQIGSSYVGGVHQLLAVRLNAEALAKGELPDFHVHLESDIISSRTALERVSELWGRWEGFSGTISPSQMARLAEHSGTDVLHVPTNLTDVRSWKPASFYEDENARYRAVIDHMKTALREKKSILIACKDDKQAKDLRDAITRIQAAESLFTPQEMDCLMLYTASDPRSSTEFLAEKHQQEKWENGSKTQGTCIIASGFGRGDNLSVQGVLVLDVSGTNELTQVGGRTARNGTEGDVYHFCLRSSLIAEEASYEKSGVDLKEIKALFAARGIAGDSDENRFQRVMALRDYFASLETQIKLVYWDARSQYSAWCLTLLGAFSPATRATFTALVSQSLDELDKEWTRLLTESSGTNAEKIAAFELKITGEAKRLAAAYNKAAEELKLPEAPALSLKLKAYNEPTIALPAATPDPIAPAIVDRSCALIKGGAPAAGMSAGEDVIARFLDTIGAPGDPDALHTRLTTLVASAPRKYLPILTKLERLTKGLDPEIAYALLDSFCTVLESIGSDKVAWSTFETLLDKTLEWWKKDKSGKYQEALCLLWRQLADKKTSLPQLSKVIQSHFSYAGKSWFVWLSQYLKLEGTILVRHQKQLVELEQEINASKLKKSEKTAYLEKVVGNLSRLYSAFSAAFDPDTLAHLDGDRFKLLMDFLRTPLFQGFSTHLDSQALSRLIGCLCDEGISKEDLVIYFAWIGKARTKNEFIFVTKMLDELSGVLFKGATAQSELKQGLVTLLDRHLLFLSNTPSLWTLVRDSVDPSKGLEFARVASFVEVLAKIDTAAQSRAAVVGPVGAGAGAALHSLSLAATGQRSIEGLMAACFTMQKQLFASLSQPRFEKFIQILETHHSFILKSADNIRPLLSWINDEAIDLARVEGAISGLAMASRQAGCNEATLTTLFSHFDVVIRNEQQSEASSRLLQTHAAKLVGLPNLAEVLRLISADAAKAPIFATLIADALAGDDGALHQQRLGGLVRYYGAVSLETLIFLSERVAANPDRQNAILFDNTTACLFELRDRALTNRAILAFYAAKAADTMVAQKRRLFGDRILHNGDLAQERKILMRLIKSEALVTREGCPSTRDAWSNEDNLAFLTTGLAWYKQKTSDILAAASVGESPKVRALTTTQQRALLSLAADMRFIAGGDAPRPETAAELRTALQTLSRDYKAKGHLATSRTRQIDTVTTNLAGADTYERALTLIHEAKLAAIRSDMTEDKTRWFKMNRTGESRFYKTLNRMEDEILKAWLMQSPDPQSLSAYHDFSRRELVDLIRCLRTRVTDYHREMDHSVTHLFTRGKEKASLVELKRVLDAFPEAGDVDLDDPVMQQAIESINTAINEKLSVFPGHLATLAKEVQARGVAMQEFLQENGPRRM